LKMSHYKTADLVHYRYSSIGNSPLAVKLCFFKLPIPLLCRTCNAVFYIFILSD